MTAEPTVLIVPGLRDHVAGHWQTLLAAELPGSRSVPPMGRGDLDCRARVDAIEAAVAAIDGPIVIVAHSGGCVMVAHWVARCVAHQVAHRVAASLADSSANAGPASCHRVTGALLAAPPDFESPMPAGYPTLDELRASGWLPVPRQPLPFPSIVAASRNDPLARFVRTEALARAWGGTLVDLGSVGHLNPASGHGPWPRAHDFIARLARGA